MAEKDTPETELDEEQVQAAVERAAKKKKMMVLGAVALLLLLVAGGGTWFALKSFGGKEASEPAAEGGNHDAGEAKQEEAHGEAKAAFYDALEPAFLANFMVNGRQHYLQLAITVMARDEDAIAALNTHMPLVRNRIVMQLSGEVFENLQTDEGRVQLQQKLLAAIQEILTKETGKPGIEQVFFTNFVMQ
jgi:flagellar FliL protein